MRSFGRIPISTRAASTPVSAKDFVPLTESYPHSTFSWSLVRTSDTYTGPVATVRRSIGGAEQTFTFDEIEAGGILAFAQANGSPDAFLRSINSYNGPSVFQNTPALQPLVVQAGAEIVSPTGLREMLFTGTQWMSMSMIATADQWVTTSVSTPDAGLPTGRYVYQLGNDDPNYEGQEHRWESTGWVASTMMPTNVNGSRVSWTDNLPLDRSLAVITHYSSLDYRPNLTRARFTTRNASTIGTYTPGDPSLQDPGHVGLFNGTIIDPLLGARRTDQTLVPEAFFQGRIMALFGWSNVPQSQVDLLTAIANETVVV